MCLDIACKQHAWLVVDLGGEQIQEADGLPQMPLSAALDFNTQELAASVFSVRAKHLETVLHSYPS